MAAINMHGRWSAGAILILVPLLHALIFMRQADAYVNSNRGDLYFRCDTGEGLTYMTSKYSDNKYDRRWDFSCAPIGTASSDTQSSGGYDVRDLHSNNNYDCASGYYMEKLESTYSSVDRLWTYTCRRPDSVQLLNCAQTSSYENSRTGNLDYDITGTNKIITGLYSKYTDTLFEWDRRWKITTCEVECDLTGDYVNSDVPRVCTTLSLSGITNGNFVADYQESFGSYCETSTAITTISTQFAASSTDRRWAFTCTKPTSGGQVITSQTWSTPAYGKLGTAFTVSCPSNTYITGVKSAYVSSFQDRVYSFQCTGYENTEISAVNCNGAVAVNAAGADFDFSTSSGAYVITSLTSTFDSSTSDREWTFTECKPQCVDGTMLNSDGYCSEPVCPQLTITHGTISGDCTGFEGDECTFESCNTGYEFSSAATTRTCDADGAWSGADITCEPITCNRLTHSQITLIGSCSGNYGDVCTYYSCPSGYALRGTTFSRECTADGWTGTEPYCELLECSELTAPTNGWRGDTCTGTLGSTCERGCNDGFVLSPTEASGGFTRTCTETTDSDGLAVAEWTGSERTCITVDCGEIVLANGQTSGECSGNYDDTCTYDECDTGYALSSGGSTRRTCGVTDGVAAWSGTSKQCEVVTCSSIEVQNGVTSGTCDGTVGGECSFTCDTGYWPSSSITTTTCVLHADGHSASWDATIATCTEVMCPTLTLEYGSVSGSCSGTVGDVCVYDSCDDGFVFGIGGSSSRTCIQDEDTAYWDGDEKTCLETIEGDGGTNFTIACAAGQAITGLYYTSGTDTYEILCQDAGASLSKRIYASAETLTVSGNTAQYCDFDTYAVSGVSKKGSTLVYDCSLLAGAELVDCTLGDTLSGSYSILASEGSVFAGIYNTGSSSPQVRVCDVRCREEDGFYSAGGTKCRQLSCGALTLTNGATSGTCSGAKGDTCTYESCNYGYELSASGDTSRTCSITNGRAEWSGVAKTCQPISTTGSPTTVNACEGLSRSLNPATCRERCERNNEDSTFMATYGGCTRVCTCGCRKRFEITQEEDDCSAHCASQGLDASFFEEHEGCRNVCLCFEASTRSTATAVTTTTEVTFTTQATGTVETIAGNGLVDWTGSSDPTATGLNQAECVAVDVTGATYIAIRHRVVSISRDGSTITTIAGTKTRGSTGVGGLATAAQLDRPTCVAVDTMGNVYISEKGNHRVSVVDASTGVLSVFVGTGEAGHRGMGGSSRAAQIHSPHGLAFDSRGTLYIADTENHVVYGVDRRSVVIDVVAGTPFRKGYHGDGRPATTAWLNAPTGIAVRGAGDLYIADKGNNRIRYVDLDSYKIIDTLVGTGRYGGDVDGSTTTAALETNLDHPEGVAVNAKGTMLVIADTNKHVLRSVSLDGGDSPVTVLAGTGSRGFNGDGNEPNATNLHSPVSVAYDIGERAIVFVDQQNRRIRRVHL
ncbi:NHL repeat-containing protein [Salpingoeca rosetta]|uniref:NHL repeat-containing protein n=1 Tax=Salpingoeca rosetta (strain ATCC 50818 / BSB-021) TaxID=946362 RepID=F2US08_SALR5|nr:NHL repeat-containing protein [Salpingoeca rosetta]EGD80413.1 NHL repeat-containing protein [Salpingoeca rosetta]|eukprot:XP_004987977.1 NHL repeat-containing protein [Salpingoeca rosetta]